MRRGVFLLALVVVGCSQKPAPWFTPSEVVAPGIELYQSSDTTLVDPPGPIAVSMVKLDPLKVRLDSVLSKDDVMGVERVDQMAARRGALRHRLLAGLPERLHPGPGPFQSACSSAPSPTTTRSPAGSHRA